MSYYPANIYLFKVNNRNTRKRSEISSKLTIKTTERRQLLTLNKFYTVFSVLLLTLNKKMLARIHHEFSHVLDLRFCFPNYQSLRIVTLFVTMMRKFFKDIPYSM